MDPPVTIIETRQQRALRAKRLAEVMISNIPKEDIEHVRSNVKRSIISMLEADFNIVESERLDELYLESYGNPEVRFNTNGTYPVPDSLRVKFDKYNSFRHLKKDYSCKPHIKTMCVESDDFELKMRISCSFTIVKSTSTPDVAMFEPDYTKRAFFEIESVSVGEENTNVNLNDRKSFLMACFWRFVCDNAGGPFETTTFSTPHKVCYIKDAFLHAASTHGEIITLEELENARK